ncbi:MAG: dihydroorotase [Bacteroidia bacterium]|nr:dihydroorotase [Bacteroidia bacterium]
MSAPLLFRNVTVIDPGSEFHERPADVLIEGTHVSQVKPGGTLSPEQANVVDIPGACISPGWVDMMVYLSDPGYEWKETLTELAQAAQSGGFTQVLCTANTQPVVDNRQILESLLLRTKGLPTELWLTGTLTVGAKGEDLAEVHDMHLAGAVAFGDGDHPVQKPGVVLRALQYLKPFEGLLISYPEDRSLSTGGQMNEGEVSVRLGFKGIPVLAESLAVARDLDVWTYTGGKIHFQPLASVEATSRVFSHKKAGTLSTGTAIYYLVLTDESLETFDPIFKLFPPLRNHAQQQALLSAIKEGQIDTLGSGHRAQALEEKDVEFEIAEPGMLGLQTFFPLANAALIDTRIISLGRLIEMIALNPRKILGKTPVSVQKGSIADFTLFDPLGEWIYQSSQIPSRSKNSPFIGQSFKGKVWGTCLKGTWQPSVF